MSKQSRPLFPQAERQMQALGLRLREARLRRRISVLVMAERVGVSRDTLHRLEKGDASIGIWVLWRALRVLGLDADMDALAQDDVLGRKLQDMAMPGPARRVRSKAML